MSMHPIGWATVITIVLALIVFYAPLGKTYADSMVRLTCTFFALILSHALWIVVAIHGALT